MISYRAKVLIIIYMSVVFYNLLKIFDTIDKVVVGYRGFGIMCFLYL